MSSLFKGLRSCLSNVVGTLLLTAVSAHAVELSITSATGEPRDQVLVRVAIGDGGGVASGGLVVRYDAAALVLENAVLTNLGKQRFALNEDGLALADGEIRLGFFTSRPPLVADGALLELTFSIAAEAAFGETSLRLEASGFADAAFNPLSPVLSDGHITVLQPIPPPQAALIADPIAGEAPLEVQFTDRSTGQIDQRLWTFGDGQASSLEDPSHIFSQPGTYTVRLEVSGPGGTDTAAVQITVHPAPPAPTVASGDGTVSLDFDVSAGDQGVDQLKGVTAGQSLAVQIILNRPSPDSRNLSFILSFDQSLLAPVDFLPEGVIAGWITLPPLVDVHRAEFGAATFTAPPIADAGDLGVVNFSVREGFQGQAGIRLEAFFIGPSSTEIDSLSPGTTVVISDAPATRPEDFDGDGRIDFTDLFLFAEAFGGTDPAFDLNGNQIVDFADFFLFAERFGTASN